MSAARQLQIAQQKMDCPFIWQSIHGINGEVRFEPFDEEVLVFKTDAVLAVLPEETSAKNLGCSLIKEKWLSQASVEDIIRDSCLYRKPMVGRRWDEVLGTWVRTKKTYKGFSDFLWDDDIIGFAEWHRKKWGVWPPCDMYCGGPGGNSNPVEVWSTEFPDYDLSDLPPPLKYRLLQMQSNKRRKLAEVSSPPPSYTLSQF